MSITVEQMQRRVATGLSMKRRAGYTLLLIAAIATTGVAGSLLATEPDLPARTRAAFAALTAIGAAWIVLASWVLARRRVLFAGHRIAAAWLAIGASAVFLAGTAAFRSALPSSAIGVGAVMFIGALACLVSARRYRARLIARRDALMAGRR